MQSSVPDFKAALLARLQEDAALASPVLVSWGHPHPADMPAETVLIGNTEDRELQFVAAMSQANETYDVEVIVSVCGPAENRIQPLFDRAYELVNAILQSVLDWRETGYSQAGLIVVPGTASDEHLISDDFREASVTQLLHVTARI